MKKKYDAAVAGHICLDIIPIIEPQASQDLSDVFIPGRLINLDGVKMSGGGAVANTGGAMNKLGLNVLPVASTGNDEFGKILMEVVKKQSGIEINPKSEKRTSYSVILTVENTDRIILHDPAGNSLFGIDDIDFEMLKQAQLFHLGYPPLLKRMYENGGEELTEIYEKAKKTGVVTSLDMSLPDVKSESGVVDWLSIMRKTLPYVDIFLPSVEEAFFIFDREEYTKVKETAGGGDFTQFIHMGKVLELGKKLIDFGCAAAVIKCGAKGIYVKTADEVRIREMSLEKGASLEDWSNIELFEESYEVQGFKSSLAAGDTAIAGFLSAFIRGRSAAGCAKTAAKTGAMCCTTHDALSGILSIEETWEDIEKRPEKIGNDGLGSFFNYDAKKETWLAK